MEMLTSGLLVRLLSDRERSRGGESLKGGSSMLRRAPSYKYIPASDCSKCLYDGILSGECDLHYEKGPY